MSRVLPARSTQPAHAGVVIQADGDGLRFTAADGELTARFRVRATTHEPGEVVVSRRGLTDTLVGLAAPEVRLIVEGNRLAVRVPGARFALPYLGDGAWPVPAGLPPLMGTVVGAQLCAAAVPVAGAASREHALPIFTGVRLRSHERSHELSDGLSHGGSLSLLATDRYRLASAAVPWQPAGTPAAAGAVLVPAAVLAESARQVARVDAVGVHADGDLFGLSWPDGSIVTRTLGGAYPDAQLDRLLDVDAESVVEVDSDALASAVDRASRYAGQHGRLAVQTIEGALLVRASDLLSGESEETVKATVQGGHITRWYQARLLSDALRPSAGHPVRVRIQAGLRATEVTTTAGPAAATDLRYLVVPMRSATPSDSG
jgi:DNA polymerase-3 subunit beta